MEIREDKYGEQNIRFSSILKLATSQSEDTIVKFTKEREKKTYPTTNLSLISLNTNRASVPFIGQKIVPLSNDKKFVNPLPVYKGHALDSLPLLLSIFIRRHCVHFIDRQTSITREISEERTCSEQISFLLSVQSVAIDKSAPFSTSFLFLPFVH